MDGGLRKGKVKGPHLPKLQRTRRKKKLAFGFLIHNEVVLLFPRCLASAIITVPENHAMENGSLV